MKKETIWLSIVGISGASYMCGIASHALERHEVIAWLVAVALFVRVFQKETFP